MNQLLDYALKYVAIGWKIFPLAPGKKTPITAHGVKDATSDEAVLREWWGKWPEANIAVACGAPSGVYVIDVDVNQEKGINGIESLVTEFDPLPITVQQTTPRGGFHVFYKTDIPPLNRNSFRPGIDIRGDGYYVVLSPSVHPNGGRYCWKHGCAPWEIALAEYPDCMRPAVKATQEPLPDPKRCRRAMQAIRDGECSPIQERINDLTSHESNLQHGILARAALYIRECDPAVQGMGGHDKLFWAAQCMVNGFCLSDSQAFSILASDYNPFCLPPWNLSEPTQYKDFFRKITEAKKTPPRDKAIGWLLVDEIFDAVAVSEDVSSLLLELEDEETSAPKAEKFDFKRAIAEEEMAKELVLVEHDFLIRPTGFLGEICSWINETSLRYQPFLTLGCSITFLGALFGRKVRDTLGNRTNLYCMGVGSSSSGKGHAPEQIFRLCEASNCLDLIGGSNTTSDSGIEERLSRNPSTIFFWDEIGHLLSDFRTGFGKNLIVPTLMGIWSSAKRTFLGKEYSDSDKQRKIIQPNLCIWGSTTPDRFTSGLSPEELRDGWIGRVLAFQTNTKPPVNDWYVESQVPEHLILKCHEWIGRGKKVINGTDLTGFATSSFTEAPPPQIVVPLTNDARGIFKTLRFTAEGESDKTLEMEYLWAKAVEQAHRIALIVAASEGTPEIGINVQVADYSCRLVKHLISEFGKLILPRIARSELEIAKMRIMDVVKLYGGKGCPKALLTRKTQWATGVSRDSMLKDLIEAGQICIELRGRAAYFWTEEFFPLRQMDD